MLKYIFKMRINCYGSTSMYSEFNFIGFLDTSSTSYDIKKDVSNSFNIPYESITGLYKRGPLGLESYTYNDFIIGLDLFIIYYTLYSLYNSYQSSTSQLNTDYSNLKNQYSTLETKNYELSSNISSLQSQCSSLESTNRELNSNYSNLQSQYNSLVSRNSSNEQKINDLNNEIIKQNEIREKKEKNFKNMKEAFEKTQKIIEEKNVEESKNFIIKFIVNKFLKEFETQKEKESDFKNSLTTHMKKFTEEYMNYSQVFLQSFKTNSQNIIKDYNIKENNKIEHINFIVLGKAGVGKSSFINESLLLTENKRAREGKGKSVTDKSVLYNSEKLQMIRMWDTQGLDYKITQEFILNEVKRLVEDGLKQGPDHYINIILYCTSGDRFQDEDGQLIYEIMKLYPSDNLPVIITQLQAYFKNKSKEMEKVIRDILENYLAHNIVQKIEIASIVSRDFHDENIVCKARGIPELLRLSFDIMGRAISSATCKKLSQDIENLCKAFVDEKNEYIHNLLKYEMEIVDICKPLYVEDTDEENVFEKKKEYPKKELSEFNMYRKIQNEKYFIDNFVKIMNNKFIHIFNHLNNENIPLPEINSQDNNNQDNNNQNNQESNNNNNKENKNEENNEKDNKNEDKPLFLFFIEDRIKHLEKKIDDASNKTFERIFKIRFQNYLSDLQREQSLKNKEFDDNSQIIDVVGVENNFKDKLFIFFKNEFFKIFLCIILKLFMNNLKEILTMNYKKELKENEIIQKIINQKAEDSLKNITQKLKEDLIKELDNFIREKEEEKNKQKNKVKNEFDNIQVDFNF